MADSFEPTPARVGDTGKILLPQMIKTGRL